MCCVILAVPWIFEVAQDLPFAYVIFVVIGIALLPGYLMSAMFLSNLINSRIPVPSKTSEKAVTVLICARNEEDCIFNTIRAIVNQKYCGQIKILCIDNGSSDRTRAEISRAAVQLQNSNRIIRMYLCPVPGKAHALNFGLSRITTEYFLTVDADTLLDENAVSLIMQKIISKKAACVAGNLLVLESKTWVQKMQIYDYLISIAAVKRYQGSYDVTLVAQGAFSVYETKAVRQVHGWTQGAGEDIVLTYQLLALGRKSLYEPRALGYTMVPSTLKALCHQRIRWASGMFEGLHAVKPWQHPSLFGGYFESLNLSIVYLDLAYVFGFLVGVILALFGMPWFVGWMTLLTIPSLLIGSISVYLFQRKIPAVHITNSFCGFLCFLILFQPIQSICSLCGYCQAITGHRVKWKS